MDSGSVMSTEFPTAKNPITAPANNLSKKKMAVHIKANERITGELYFILMTVQVVYMKDNPNISQANKYQIKYSEN